MFGFGSKKEEVDSDPNKIIVGWTGNMQPPKWAEKDSYVLLWTDGRLVCPVS
jgi:hypothetical protein